MIWSQLHSDDTLLCMECPSDVERYEARTAEDMFKHLRAHLKENAMQPSVSPSIRPGHTGAQDKEQRKADSEEQVRANSQESRGFETEEDRLRAAARKVARSQVIASKSDTSPSHHQHRRSRSAYTTSVRAVVV